MSDEETIQDVGFFTRARAIEEAARYIHQHFTLAGTNVEVGVVVYQLGKQFFIGKPVFGESDTFIAGESMGIRPLPGGFTMAGAPGVPVAFVHSHPRPGSLPHMSASDRALGRDLFRMGSGPFVIAAVDATGETWLKEFAGRTLPNGAPADVGGKGSRFGNANNPVTLGEVTIVGRPPETTSGGGGGGTTTGSGSSGTSREGRPRDDSPKPNKPVANPPAPPAPPPVPPPPPPPPETAKGMWVKNDAGVFVWSGPGPEPEDKPKGAQNESSGSERPPEKSEGEGGGEVGDGSPPATTDGDAGGGDEGDDERVDPTGDSSGGGDSRPGQFHPNYLTMDARMMLAMADLAWRRGQGPRPPSGGPTDIWQPFKGKTSGAAPEVARSRGRMLEKSAFMDAALLGALGKQGSHGPSDGSDQIPLTRTVGDEAEAEAAANRDDVRRMLWKKHVEPRILTASQRTRRTP